VLDVARRGSSLGGAIPPAQDGRSNSRAPGASSMPRAGRTTCDGTAAKYRLSKERLAPADITAILVNETLAELSWRTFPRPPRTIIQRLQTGIGVPNWTAILAGPVAVEYQQAFARVLERLQGQIELVS